MQRRRHLLLVVAEGGWKERMCCSLAAAAQGHPYWHQLTGGTAGQSGCRQREALVGRLSGAAAALLAPRGRVKRLRASRRQRTPAAENTSQVKVNVAAGAAAAVASRLGTSPEI
jgi:hypothetical protein